MTQTLSVPLTPSIPRTAGAEYLSRGIRRGGPGDLGGLLFYEYLLDGAIVEDEDVQALLEGGMAMAVEGVDEGVFRVES